MGLFDGFVDPEQFNSGGGLLGRLLALQRFQGRPGADFDQGSSVPQTPSPASMLSPLLSNYGQQAPAPANWQNSVAAGGRADPVGLATSTSAPNTVLAQYVPTRPAGIPLPPVFVPGTPENDAFVHSTITAGRTIGNAVGNILNNDNADRPPAGSRPINETPWSGDHGEIKDGINAGATDNVKISPTGEVWALNPDGSWTNHGPADSFTGSGKPSGRRGKDRDR